MPKGGAKVQKLIYADDGRFLNGIPAHDLEPADLEALASRANLTAEELRAALLASGIYQSPPAEPAATAEVASDG